MINELKQLYEEYAKTAYEVRKKAPLFAGFLGLGNDPRKHACHEEFYEAALKWMERFVASGPAPEAVMEVATYILDTPDQNRDTDSYWFMYVVVGNIRSLVPLLRKEDCKILAARFDELYKKRDRMPVQVETYKMLVKAAK